MFSRLFVIVLFATFFAAGPAAAQHSAHDEVLAPAKTQTADQYEPSSPEDEAEAMATTELRAEVQARVKDEDEAKAKGLSDNEVQVEVETRPRRE